MQIVNDQPYSHNFRCTTSRNTIYYSHMKPNSTWYANLQRIRILMMSVISAHVFDMQALAKGPPCQNHIFLARPESSCTLAETRPEQRVGKGGGGLSHMFCLLKRKH